MHAKSLEEHDPFCDPAVITLFTVYHGETKLLCVALHSVGPQQVHAGQLEWDSGPCLLPKKHFPVTAGRTEGCWDGPFLEQNLTNINPLAKVLDSCL
jgi:hypothetical protein